MQSLLLLDPHLVEAFENVNVLPIITRALGLKDVDNIDGTYQIAELVIK